MNLDLYVIALLLLATVALISFEFGRVFGKRDVLRDVEYCDCQLFDDEDDEPEIVYEARKRLEANDILNAEVIE